jgi:hypothetical protein
MKIKRLLAAFMLLCILALSSAFPAFAAERSCSLTLTCSVGGGRVSGVVCSLYRVADLSGTAFTPVPAFENAGIKVNGLTTDAKWQAAADSLAVYAAAGVNHIVPDRQEKSDGGGTIAFSGLTAGLYLAVFSTVTNGLTTYRFSADLLSLPQWDGSGTVRYDAEASPKGTSTEKTNTAAGLTVLKIWNDGGDQTLRPESISVTLFCDGNAYDETTLTGGNNWRYSWSGLPENHSWSVLENNVPEGYTVTYSSEGAILTIVNQSTTDIPEEPTPKSGRLPQTGMLWWPVPMLAIAGLFLFAAGWHRKNENTHET